MKSDTVTFADLAHVTMFLRRDRLERKNEHKSVMDSLAALFGSKVESDSSLGVPKKYGSASIISKTHYAKASFQGRE